MKCRRARALIYDFIDGMISDQDRLALEQHLGECTACEAAAAGASRSLDLLHRLPQAQPSDNFNWKVRLGIAKARNAVSGDPASERSWLRSWNVRFALSALSAFVVVASSSYFLMRANVAPTTRLTLSAPQEAVDAEKSGSPLGTLGQPVSTRGGIGPSVVSTDERASRAHSDNPGLLEELPGTDLNTDSLMTHFLKSQLVRFRIRQLEQQVEILQGELRNCERRGQ